HVTGVQTCALPISTKYQNSTANLLTACTHDDVADEVIYMNDDFFILRPLDRIPHLHMGPVENRVRYYDTKYERRVNGAGRYRDGMVQTADLLRSWEIGRASCRERGWGGGGGGG